MENPPDWDLLAVVRSCCSTTLSATSTAVHAAPETDLPPYPSYHHPPPPQQQFDQCFRFTNPFEAAAAAASTTSFLQDLQDICKQPLICTTNSNNNTTTTFQSVSSPASSSSSSFIGGGRSFGVVTEQPPLRRLINPTQVVFGAPPPGAATTTTSQAQRTKKRKNLMKKVCHVPAEGLSSDMWAWRKYGQKPIKGSPYPRGYYRCSSSKGCMARKQVERNRSDPKMFIITYTAEHNHPMPTHRNSLAGSTRQKPLTSTQQTFASGDTTAATPPEQPTCSSPSAASLSPKTEGEDLMKEENENENENVEDNEMGLSELMLNDDFYVGFEQIDGDDDGSDCFSDHFSPSMEFPWLVNTSSTATAAGGS